MCKIGAEKLWHQFLNTTGKFGTKFPDCGTRTKIDCEWWLLFPLGLWLLVISWRLLDGCGHFFWRLGPCGARCPGTMGMCMPRALKMTPTKTVSDLQMPWHILAHFCCAKFGSPKFRLFLPPPPPRWLQGSASSCERSPPRHHQGAAETTLMPESADGPEMTAEGTGWSVSITCETLLKADLIPGFCGPLGRGQSPLTSPQFGGNTGPRHHATLPRACPLHRLQTPGDTPAPPAASCAPGAATPVSLSAGAATAARSCNTCQNAPMGSSPRHVPHHANKPPPTRPEFQ